MFTKISSFILAILLFLVFLGSKTNPFVFAASVIVMIFATVAINFKRLNFTWPHLMLPLIYLLAAGSVFSFIGSSTIQVFYLIIVTIVFYILEVKLGHESHFLQNVYLFSVFGLYLALFAYQFILQIKVWVMVPIIFVLTYLLAVQGFAGFSLPSKKYFYTLLAIVCSEVVWGLSFWPTHYFVNAVVVFSFFYILWLFSFSAFFGKLTRQKVFWQLALITIILAVSLSTTAWRPIR